jgi:hypothetical protein
VFIHIYKLHLTVAKAMLKRFFILLSSLAYSVTLVHNVVPHHHHQEAAETVLHHHHHEEDHHHSDDEKGSLSHTFADAIHHPAAEQVVHGQLSESSAKSKTIQEHFILALTHLLLAEQEPPDYPIPNQSRSYSHTRSALSLLRAPPAI